MTAAAARGMHVAPLFRSIIALTIAAKRECTVNDGICSDYGGMKTESEWATDVKRLLRAEMTRRGVTYEQLTERLAAIGVHDSATNIRNKVARGKFTAVFLIQCMEALGCRTIRLDLPHYSQDS